MCTAFRFTYAFSVNSLLVLMIMQKSENYVEYRKMFKVNITIIMNFFIQGYLFNDIVVINRGAV